MSDYIGSVGKTILYDEHVVIDRVGEDVTMTFMGSKPIDECLKDCTAAERKAIAEHTPPYDGVRTWGDLLTVREAKKNDEQPHV